MPAAYAHYRFGRDCLETLPAKLREICERYIDLYDLGVHGPDILFYYHPLSKNEVNSFGSGMHRWNGREFFTLAKGVYVEHDHKGPMLAYLLGFLAHFTLDSGAHAYINHMDEVSEVSHNYIESQYEAFLMRKDGMDPLKVNRADYLHPTKKAAGIISRFFAYPEETVYQAIKSQKQTMKLLYSPAEHKKKGLRKLIEVLPVNSGFSDLFLDEQEHPACRETNQKIWEIQKRGIGLYPVLARSMVRNLQGRGELSERFLYDFEGVPHED